MAPQPDPFRNKLRFRTNLKTENKLSSVFCTYFLSHQHFLIPNAPRTEVAVESTEQ